MRAKVIILMLGICSFGSAQKPHIVTFEKVQIKSDFGFDVIEWVDLRPNKSNIGWAQKGMSNRKVFAVLDSPVENVMKKFFSEKGKEINIAVRFRQLFINELTKATKEFGFADVSLEIFLVNGEKYNYLETITYSSRSKAADVTKKHGQNILNAVNGALSFIETDHKSDIFLTAEEWESNAPIFLNTENLPILNSTPKDGLFVTLKEFIENRPREANLIFEKKKQFIEVINNNSLKPEEITYGFAVAKNGKAYIRYQEGFQELIRVNNSFFFEGPEIVDANKVSKGAIIGGAIGAGIAAASSKEKWKYKLDLSTGEKIPLEKIR